MKNEKLSLVVLFVEIAVIALLHAQHQTSTQKIEKEMVKVKPVKPEPQKPVNQTSFARYEPAL